MKKIALALVMVLGLVLVSSASAAPPTKGWGTERTLGKLEGDIAQYFSRTVIGSDRSVFVLYASNKDSQNFTSIITGNVQEYYNWYVRKLDANGKVLWTSAVSQNDIMLEDVPDYLSGAENNIPVCLSAGSNGDAYVLYRVTDPANSTKSLYLTRVDNTGSVATPLQLDNNTSLNYPRLVRDNSGGVYTAWLTNFIDPGGINYFYGNLARYDANLQPLGVKLQFPSNGNTVNMYDLAMVSDNLGGVCVAYSKYTGANSGRYEVFGFRRDANGNNLWGDPAETNPIKLFTDLTGTYSYNNLEAQYVNGNLFAVCNYTGMGAYGVRAQRVDGLGTLVWNDINTPNTPDGKLVANTGSSVSSGPAAMAIDILGSLLVAYKDYTLDTDDGDLAVGGIDKDGTLIGAATICNARGFQGWQKIAASPTGGAYIVWADNRDAGIFKYQDIYAAKVSATLVNLWQANGLPIAKAQGYQSMPVLRVIGGKDFPETIGIAWSDSRSIDSPLPTLSQFDISGVTLNSSGNVLSTVIIDDKGKVPNSYSGACYVGGGKTCITWTTCPNGVPQIYAKFVDLSGNPQSADIPLTSKNEIALAASTVRTSDGNILVVWSGVDEATYKALQQSIVKAAGVLSGKSVAPNLNNALRLYALKMDPSGRILWSGKRLSNNWYLNSDLLPALAPDLNGGAYVAYAPINIFAQQPPPLPPPPQGADAQAAAVRPRAGGRYLAGLGSQLQAKDVVRKEVGEVDPLTQQLVAVKHILSDGSLSSLAGKGQTPDELGLPVVNPTVMAKTWKTVTQFFPAMQELGDGRILIVWADNRAGEMNKYPVYNIMAQIIDGDGKYQLSETGVGLTSLTSELNYVKAHILPKLARMGSRIGLTWTESIGYQVEPTSISSQIFAAGLDSGLKLIWGPTAVSDKFTAYPGQASQAQTAVLFSDIKLFRNLESVVSWQDLIVPAKEGGANKLGALAGQSVSAKAVFGQNVILSPNTIYAMHLGADGAKKLATPFKVSQDKVRLNIMPILVDLQDGNSLQVFWDPAEKVESKLVEPSALILRYFSSAASTILSPDTEIQGNRVGFVLPMSIQPVEALSMSPTSVTYRFADICENEEGFMVKDTDGNLKAAFPPGYVEGAPLECQQYNLAPNTGYQFNFGPYNTAGESLQAYNFWTLAETPSGLVANTTGPAGIALSWNPQANARFKVARYEVNPDGSEGQGTILSGTDFSSALGASNYLDSSADKARNYKYRIYTYNQVGNINPYEAQILTSYNRLSPDFSQIRFSINRAPGQTLRARDPIGDEILIRATDLNPDGIINLVVVTFTNTKTGQKYITRIDPRVTSASVDDYKVVPTNIPSGNYDMEITVFNDSNLSATKTINVNKYDYIQVIGGMAVVVPKGALAGPLSIKDVGAADFATIGYMLTKTGDVQMQILDSGGQTLMRKVIPANLEGARVGPNEVTWNGITLSGSGIGRGLYLGQILSGGKIIGRFAFPVQ